MIKKAFVVVVCCFLMPFAVFADQKKIILTATEWEPYTGEKLLNGGFLVDISTEALKRAGYAVEVKFMPWKRSLLYTQEGRCDALAGASYTEERTATLAYPEYFYKSTIAFFTQKGGKTKYEKLEDLCPATVGILRGSFLIERLEPVKCLEQYLGSEVLTNVKMLVHNRVDYMLDTKEAVYFALNKYLPDKIEAIQQVDPPLVIDKLYTVFSRKNPAYETIVKDYDKGIQAIKSDGTLDKILENQSVK